MTSRQLVADPGLDPAVPSRTPVPALHSGFRDFRLDLLGWVLHPSAPAHSPSLISACLRSGSLQPSAEAGAVCAARIIRVLQGA